jgi:hypothetical protein
MNICWRERERERERERTQKGQTLCCSGLVGTDLGGKGGSLGRARSKAPVLVPDWRHELKAWDGKQNNSDDYLGPFSILIKSS